MQRLWISQVMFWNSGVFMSDIAKAWNLHTDNQHPDGKTRELFKVIIFTTSSKFMSETLSILWKIQVALKSTLIWKCAKTVVWNQSWFQGWLEIKVKIHELTWNSRLFSKWARIPFPLSAYAILLSLKNLLVLINTKLHSQSCCYFYQYTQTLDQNLW